MKLGLLINDLRNGGAERLVADLAVELNEREGIDPAVLVVNRNGEFVSTLETSGIPVRSLDVEVSTPTIPRGVRALSKLLATGDIELVHSHLSYSHVVGRLACARQSIPHVSTYHNVCDHKTPLKRAAERTTRPLSDRIVCVSEGVRQSYTTTDDMVVIYNGIDHRAFRERVTAADTSGLLPAGSTDTTVFLNVARCVEQKRQTDLVDAVAELDATDLHLFIVGDGPRRASLEERVSDKGLSDQITVAGYVDRIEPYYAVADAFVSSSSREGLPSTHLEAKAAGLPIISTEIPGVRELVEHETDGYLCRVGKPSEIAAYMRTIHDTDPYELGKRGFEAVTAEFSLTTIATDHAELYRNLI